jgi:hypothetical protein
MRICRCLICFCKIGLTKIITITYWTNSLWTFNFRILVHDRMCCPLCFSQIFLVKWNSFVTLILVFDRVHKLLRSDRIRFKTLFFITLKFRWLTNHFIGNILFMCLRFSFGSYSNNKLFHFRRIIPRSTMMILFNAFFFVKYRKITWFRLNLWKICIHMLYVQVHGFIFLT